MGRKIEGYWDCPYCNRKGIQGRFRECPECNKPRGEGVTFYMLDTKTLDKDLESHFTGQPDWECSYCKQLNPSVEENCISCGAPKVEQSGSYFDMQNRMKADIPENPVNRTTKQQSKKSILGIVLLAVFLLGIAALVIKQAQPVEMTVLSHSWQKTQEIEAYQTVNESSFTLPDDARLQYTAEEISSYVQVLDHYETVTEQVAHERIAGYHTEVSGYRDLGDGTFEEITTEVADYETYYTTETHQEPVYRNDPVFSTKYYYEIDKWMIVRDVVSEGNGKTDYVGDYSLEKGMENGIGAERTGSLYEIYSIVLQSEKGENNTYEIEEDIWRRLNDHDKISVKIGIGGKLTILDETSVTNDK